MENMNKYAKSPKKRSREAEKYLDQAIQTLDLSKVSPIIRQEKGVEAAIFLKEVIDRVIIIDYAKIPDSDIEKWRLKDTSITIVKVADGINAGDFLFSAKTVDQSRVFFKQVADLPYLPGSGKGAGYKPSLLETAMPVWTKKISFGLYRWQWIGLLVAFLLGLIIKFITEKIMNRVEAFVQKTKGKWDDQLLAAVQPPVGLMSAALVWFLSIKILQIGGQYLNFLSTIVQIVFSLACVWLAYRLAGFATELVRHFSRNKNFLLDSHLEPLFLTALQMFVLVFGILVSLQNLGINVMSLLAGLGLGGLAFALAAKDTAANVFGSIMILWDKPFRVGDWIVADAIEGTVEEIGFRSTRVRTFYKSQVTIPNSHLANVSVDNMGRRSSRRIKAYLNLTYDTSLDKINAFVDGIKSIIQNSPHTDKDNYHVYFNNYNSSSLDVLLYCFLKVDDWGLELKERENLLLEIKKLAENLGVSFAFPTRTLHIESAD